MSRNIFNLHRLQVNENPFFQPACIVCNSYFGGCAAYPCMQRHIFLVNGYRRIFRIAVGSCGGILLRGEIAEHLVVGDGFGLCIITVSFRRHPVLCLPLQTDRFQSFPSLDGRIKSILQISHIGHCIYVMIAVRHSGQSE